MVLMLHVPAELALVTPVMRVMLIQDALRFRLVRQIHVQVIPCLLARLVLLALVVP